MRYSIVSASDSEYFDFLRGLVLSIRHKPSGADVDIHIFDLGLSPEHIGWLNGKGCKTIIPGWDITFPNQSSGPRFFQAMTARPFIPQHIPGYDMFFWIDADAWIQDWAAVEVYLQAASRVGAAFTPEIDRSYKSFYDKGQSLDWKHACYETAFGKDIADKMAGLPLINSGVFAVRADSPLWSKWQMVLTQALQRTQDFYVEQTALNFSVYNGIPCAMMPSTFNWHCAFALPRIEEETGLLLSHLYPKTRIGIVHLCGGIKKKTPLMLETDAGGSCLSDLRYPRWNE